jgi:hypothetical protein
MRQLWIHRDVEILQNRLTMFLHSSRFCNRDRVHITWEWNKIQKEMNEVLKEMDDEVEQRLQAAVKIECQPAPKK